jgi:hypothetical protein
VRLLLAIVLAVPVLASAQVLSAAVSESNGPSEATTRKVQKTLDATLKALSGASLKESQPYKKGAPRKCGDDCARDTARNAATPAVAVIDLKGSDAKLTFELSVWVDGEKTGSRKGETPLEALEPSLRAAVEQVLPAWMRRGYGAMSVQVEGGSVVKVDGRVVAARNGDLVPVPAGAHQVDVVFPDGNAMLQRLEVPESGRVPLEVESSKALTARASASPTALRYASFGLFMAGAGTMAAGLIAGALMRGTGIGLTSCSTPEARACSTLAEVQQRQQQAQQYASTGNVLMGVGASLAALGVSLFVVDLLLQ